MHHGLLTNGADSGSNISYRKFKLIVFVCKHNHTSTVLLSMYLPSLYVDILLCIAQFLCYLSINASVPSAIDNIVFNPLPSGTLATFFLTAVGPIQHTKEGDISREKTILMTSLRLERAAAVR